MSRSRSAASLLPANFRHPERSEGSRPRTEILHSVQDDPGSSAREAGEPSLPDLIAPGVELLFVGINPGLKSARVGHYYAGPGNLFWRALHHAGLTPVLLRPEEDLRLLEFGIGITDCVKRASRTASEVRREEFRSGVPELMRKIETAGPALVCFNGLMGYRSTFDPTASLGLQPGRLAGAAVFVVPSTSAANAGFTREERLEWFRRLRELRDSLRGRSERPPAGDILDAVARQAAAGGAARAAGDGSEWGE